MIRYVTRGTRLFEVLEIATDANHGIMGGQLITYTLVDLGNPDAWPFRVSQEILNRDYKPVKVAPEDADELAAKLHADLDRWLEEVPWWVG